MPSAATQCGEVLLSMPVCMVLALKEWVLSMGGRVPYPGPYIVTLSPSYKGGGRYINTCGAGCATVWSRVEPGAPLCTLTALRYV